MIDTPLHIARRTFIASLAMNAFVPPAQAQVYPDRPVRVVVAFPPGGPADIGMRIVADRLALQLGRALVIDNRPGAGGTIGTELVAGAAPDGYTLLLTGNHVAIGQALSAAPRYDVVRDFVPVARFGVLPSGLFVEARSPHASLADLLVDVRKRPDELTYASGGNGTPSHLAMELLKRRANLAIRHIPYEGTPPAVTDLIGGQVHMLFTSIAGPMAQVKSGRLRQLAVSSPRRLASLPDVPSIGEVVPGYAFETWLGVAAPKGTPAHIVMRLSEEIAAALQDAGVRERMESAGLTPSFVGPAELRARVEDEAAQVARIVKDANIKAE